MTGTRTESDSFGPIEVDTSRYWGAQTQRSLMNFKIGGERMPPALVRALGIVKLAAARVNQRQGSSTRGSAEPSRRPPPRSSTDASTTISRSSSGRPAPAPRPT